MNIYITDNFLFYIFFSILLISIFMIHQNNKNDINDICPITGNRTRITGCIEYPLYNEAYLISVYSNENIKDIQESFDKNDNRYRILKHDHNIYLYNKDKMISELIECNILNMKRTLELTRNHIR